ncbi:MAG TPA: hypothetical protein PLG94_16575 [Smithellaceae bacterium]|jgi:hypothetical protein|nr:hypothetical protein [Smithellaceae bacterium]
MATLPPTVPYRPRGERWKSLPIMRPRKRHILVKKRGSHCNPLINKRIIPPVHRRKKKYCREDRAIIFVVKHPRWHAAAMMMIHPVDIRRCTGIGYIFELAKELTTLLPVLWIERRAPRPVNADR